MNDAIIKSNEILNSIWKFRVYSLQELRFYLKYCSDKLKNTDGFSTPNVPHIWFRGQSSDDEKYKLIPTLIRKYVNYKSGTLKNDFPTIRAFQQYLFEEFKFRADDSQEAISNAKYTISDYIALMQHYQEISNFLDWTENAYKALYFALYNVLKNMDKSNITVDNDKNTTITIFNPYIYNEQRKKIILELRGDETSSSDLLWKNNEIFSKIYRNETLFPNKIPNLSIKNNEKNYNMFLLGDSAFDDFYSSDEKRIKYEAYINGLKNKEKEKEIFLPIAIWTSRLNPRIRTQSGCFVAFNLYTPPDNNLESPYVYMSLDSIQERFKNYFSNNMFMYQIVIDKSCCNEIAQWLRNTMGMSRSDVFPDLSQLKLRFDG